MRPMQRANQLFIRLFSNWPAKALALVAAIILYLLVGLDNIQERYISVPIHLVLPSNLVPGQEYPQFVRVYLKGQGDDIFSISEDEIQVNADFSAFKEPGVFQVALTHKRLGKAESIEPLEVSLDPGKLTLELEQKVSVELPVVPQISGSPASGYELSSYTVIPDSLTVYGPKSLMDGIKELQTADIEVSGHDSNYSAKVTVLQPTPLVGFESSRVVEFRAEISDSILVTTFENIPVNIVGLSPDLSASVSGLEGSIRAQASQSLIRQTEPEAISLVIDASDITTPGSYTLAVRPVVPRGFVIFRFDPLEVSLDVTEAKP